MRILILLKEICPLAAPDEATPEIGGKEDKNREEFEAAQNHAGAEDPLPQGMNGRVGLRRSDPPEAGPHIPQSGRDRPDRGDQVYIEQGEARGGNEKAQEVEEHKDVHTIQDLLRYYLASDLHMADRLGMN